MAAISFCSLTFSSIKINPTNLRNNFGINKFPAKLVIRAQQVKTELPTKCNKALAAAAAICVVLSSQSSMAGEMVEEFSKYYGTAASAANYGGYGGNASKKDSAEYTYDVPSGWKERLVSKVEKGTNGTDSEFYNPKRKAEKEYLTFLAGFRTLAPMDSVLNNLSLSDVNLQDIISSANSVKSTERRGANGQVYYDFEIDSPMAHSLISVTCAKNKLYAHFVNAPAQDWTKDEAMLKHIHESFSTVGMTDSA
ncbi:hypothetical protein SUGI_0995350 [Cryptomeria japonica]|uniref:thylakoid lumenal 19 kDa protein, chloroplastic n=1 Tax=Cryptomeria japonica TaxID=3369 RepID=UPI00241480A1|nr:thylakoid lumenal 19 kDa protein, chloroplastic [Cryptomeria japonica]GLJ47145.1 hypothetical protein SUGI_0995350 [Cryptomeria japonica]